MVERITSQKPLRSGLEVMKRPSAPLHAFPDPTCSPGQNISDCRTPIQLPPRIMQSFILATTASSTPLPCTYPPRKRKPCLPTYVERRSQVPSQDRIRISPACTRPNVIVLNRWDRYPLCLSILWCLEPTVGFPYCHYGVSWVGSPVHWTDATKSNKTSMATAISPQGMPAWES